MSKILLSHVLITHLAIQIQLAKLTIIFARLVSILRLKPEKRLGLPVEAAASEFWMWELLTKEFLHINLLISPAGRIGNKCNMWCVHWIILLLKFKPK